MGRPQYDQRVRRRIIHTDEEMAQIYRRSLEVGVGQAARELGISLNALQGRIERYLGRLSRASARRRPPAFNITDLQHAEPDAFVSMANQILEGRAGFGTLASMV